MELELELQNVTQFAEVPKRAQLQQWAQAALPDEDDTVELVIRLVDEYESRQLNREFRRQDKPTNVLSFPFEPPPGFPNMLLGDLVICAPLVAKEAKEQGKPVMAHWAHLVVHGVLHLRGFDHLQDKQAQQMEALEIEILAGLGFPDPYQQK